MALGIVSRHKIQNVKIKLNHLHNYVDNVILKKQKMGLLKCQSDPILISGTKIH